MTKSNHIFPARKSLGAAEREAIHEVIDYYEIGDREISYGGYFQQRYEADFANLMGGEKSGFSTAVCSGTVACFLALKALDLPPKSEVIISPVTDSGPLMAILELGLTPVVADTAGDNTYNTSYEEVNKVVTRNTRAVFLVHSGGIPVKEDDILRMKNQLGLSVIEDCSQAPFAQYIDREQGGYVGTLGDISAFSTMYRKNFHTGSSGGIIYCKSKELHHRLIEITDRGRPKWSNAYSGRDPGDANKISLNYNTDEISCAIGSASLARVLKTIQLRKEFISSLTEQLGDENIFENLPAADNISPFFYPLLLRKDLRSKKASLCKWMANAGIPLAEDYACFVQDWKFVKRLALSRTRTSNAVKAKKNIFNLFLNENYSDIEAKYIAGSVKEWIQRS